MPIISYTTRSALLCVAMLVLRSHASASPATETSNHEPGGTGALLQLLTHAGLTAPLNPSGAAVLAGNGSKAGKASAEGAKARLETHPAGQGLSVLVLERPENGDVSWRVKY